MGVDGEGLGEWEVDGERRFNVVLTFLVVHLGTFLVLSALVGERAIQSSFVSLQS